MNKKVTATELKRNTAKILNEVIYTTKPVDIYKYGEIVASIVSCATTRKENEEDKFRLLDKKWAGFMPDFPNVTKDRVNKDFNKLYGE